MKSQFFYKYSYRTRSFLSLFLTIKKFCDDIFIKGSSSSSLYIHTFHVPSYVVNLFLKPHAVHQKIQKPNNAHAKTPSSQAVRLEIPHVVLSVHLHIPALNQCYVMVTCFIRIYTAFTFFIITSTVKIITFIFQTGSICGGVVFRPLHQ